MTKKEIKLKSLEKSLKRLEESLSAYDDEIYDEQKIYFRDSAIKRFEMCFDLAWKSLKEYLWENFGSEYTPPRLASEKLS